jgi:hydroxymethylbilane synthase
MIAQALLRNAPEVLCEEVPVVTEGDRLVDRPLPEIGGKGVFTEALERALLTREIDLAVHSLKDLPVEDPPGLVLAALSFREDPRDVLVAREEWSVDTLPRGARVGTSSTRRAAQLRARRPDLELLDLRGNVDTRVRQVRDGRYDAIVLAAAGMARLGLAADIASYLAFEDMLPAPGQGALAIQCRLDDPGTISAVSGLDQPEVRQAVTAERAFLEGLGGGCAAPVAALGEILPSGALRLRGRVLARDGSRVVAVQGEGSPTEARNLGFRLAREARARGAEALLQ